jgi:hypothetical protein
LRNLLTSSPEEAEEDAAATTENNSPAKQDGYFRSIQFCLLFLGDVARWDYTLLIDILRSYSYFFVFRYAELHGDTRKAKNWSAARGYYLRAKQVLPTIGNPYNQVIPMLLAF